MVGNGLQYRRLTGYLIVEGLAYWSTGVGQKKIAVCKERKKRVSTVR